MPVYKDDKNGSWYKPRLFPNFKAFLILGNGYCIIEPSEGRALP